MNELVCDKCSTLRYKVTGNVTTTWYKYSFFNQISGWNFAIFLQLTQVRCLCKMYCSQGKTCIDLRKKYLHVFVDNLLHMKGLTALSCAKLPDWKVSRAEQRQYGNVTQTNPRGAYPTRKLYQLLSVVLTKLNFTSLVLQKYYFLHNFIFISKR